LTQWERLSVVLAKALGAGVANVIAAYLAQWIKGKEDRWNAGMAYDEFLHGFAYAAAGEAAGVSADIKAMFKDDPSGKLKAIALTSALAAMGSKFFDVARDVVGGKRQLNSAGILLAVKDIVLEGALAAVVAVGQAGLLPGLTFNPEKGAEIVSGLLTPCFYWIQVWPKALIS
jgi:hypothetical protein